MPGLIGRRMLWGGPGSHSTAFLEISHDSGASSLFDVYTEWALFYEGKPIR